MEPAERGLKRPGRLRRRLMRAAVDAADVARGRREPGLPPRSLQGLAGGGFHRIGAEFEKLFVELGGLRPEHAVLDVGCGAGRIALPLTGWLSGPYEGFDVIPAAIRWCQNEITPRHPNFRFQLADVQNTEYNPRGRATAEDYRFPYDDASFDFAYLTSVFTHLRAPAVANYLSELHRVLRPGARLFATYFLLNEESRALMSGYHDFRFGEGAERYIDHEVPERAVAFDEGAVRESHTRAGLPVRAVHYGSWCGRERYLRFQDLVISGRA